jgi:hypothetical protein
VVGAFAEISPDTYAIAGLISSVLKNTENLLYLGVACDSIYLNSES